MIIEDRIEYNDLVDSIQDDGCSCEDKSEDVVTGASNDVESNNGNFLVIAIIILPLSTLVEEFQRKVMASKVVDDKS